jgi:hypothetical protein
VPPEGLTRFGKCSVVNFLSRCFEYFIGHAQTDSDEVSGAKGRLNFELYRVHPFLRLSDVMPRRAGALEFELYGVHPFLRPSDVMSRRSLHGQCC